MPDLFRTRCGPTPSSLPSSSLCRVFARLEAKIATKETQGNAVLFLQTNNPRYRSSVPLTYFASFIVSIHHHKLIHVPQTTLNSCVVIGMQVIQTIGRTSPHSPFKKLTWDVKCHSRTNYVKRKTHGLRCLFPLSPHL